MKNRTPSENVSRMIASVNAKSITKRDEQKARQAEIIAKFTKEELKQFYPHLVVGE